MSSVKRVVVYGANGYTGRLVCEFLRQFQIPFRAVGRNRQRVEEAMQKVPGIETADYEVVEAEHTVESLTRAFAGATVVCNIVGPFVHYGETVVKAALQAGCHYIDTTGEQPYMLLLRDSYGAEFAKKGLLLAPATAYMHAMLEIAVDACATHEEIDTIEATCIPTGTPTFGSTQTFIQMVRAKEYYLEAGKLLPWPPAFGADVASPHTLTPMFALPWSGSPLPLWYQNHTRIRTLKSLTGFTSRDLMLGIHGVFKMYHEKLAPLPEAEQVAELEKIGAGMQPGMPPRENPLVHRCYDVAIGTGSMGSVRYVVYSHSPYQATGLFQAYACSLLLGEGPAAVGFRSPGQAFGSRNILAVLERFGYARLVREK